MKEFGEYDTHSMSTRNFKRSLSKKGSKGSNTDIDKISLKGHSFEQMNKQYNDNNFSYKADSIY